MAFDSLSDIFAVLRSRFPALDQRWKETQAIVRWEGAVGPQIAKHARAIRIQDGVLWIEVDHPVWRTEIHHRKAQILTRVNEGRSGDHAIQDLLLIEPKREGRPTFKGWRS